MGICRLQVKSLTAWFNLDVQRREILYPVTNVFYVVGPCHHGMARPQVADRGTASDKEGSCE